MYTLFESLCSMLEEPDVKENMINPYLCRDGELLAR